MYKIIFLDEVIKDLDKIDKSIKNHIFKKLQQLAVNPQIWKDLWNKNNLNLSWCKKIYVYSKKIRIVYKIIDEKIEILVIAIWKRENMEVYNNAFKII